MLAELAAEVVSIERIPALAAQAARNLGDTTVELHVGDWRDVLPSRAPFEFLFFDAGKLDESREAIELLAPGGLLLKDDLTPGRATEGDPVRQLLLHHPDLVATEILTTPSTAAIVAVRYPKNARATS